MHSKNTILQKSLFFVFFLSRLFGSLMLCINTNTCCHGDTDVKIHPVIKSALRALQNLMFFFFVLCFNQKLSSWDIHWILAQFTNGKILCLPDISMIHFG